MRAQSLLLCVSVAIREGLTSTGCAFVRPLSMQVRNFDRLFRGPTKRYALSSVRLLTWLLTRAVLKPLMVCSPYLRQGIALGGW
jgi:hypothetical protein